MRIALVSREFMPFGGAGIGTYAQYMARAWADAGHEVVAIMDPSLEVQARAGAPLPGIQVIGVRPSGATGERDFVRYARGVHEALLNAHQQAPFDYIEFPDYWAEGSFALDDRRRLEGAVIGIRLHTPSRICSILNDDRGTNPYVAELVEREDAAIVKADLLISPTVSLLEWVERELPAVGRQPRFVVRYPFDASSVIDLGVARDEIAAVRPAADIPVMLCFGRLERRKGVHLFVEAAVKLLREGVRAHFRVIGGDTNTAPNLSSMRDWLVAQIPAQFRASLTIEDPRPRVQLGAIIRSAQACVFPALWDNFPNALLEAMTLRACCIGAEAGGIGEVIQHERNGLLFPAGDTHALTEVLRRAIADPDLCARLGAAAPARVSALCSPRAIVAEVESLVSAGLADKASAQRTPR